MSAAPGPPWSAVECISTHPHDVRLRRTWSAATRLSRGAARWSYCSGTGSLALTRRPSHGLAWYPLEGWRAQERLIQSTGLTGAVDNPDHRPAYCSCQQRHLSGRAARGSVAPRISRPSRRVKGQPWAALLRWGTLRADEPSLFCLKAATISASRLASAARAGLPGGNCLAGAHSTLLLGKLFNCPRLDLPENLPLGTHRDDAPVAAHALGELGDGIGMARAEDESSESSVRCAIIPWRPPSGKTSPSVA
jgi:hypothetical protein